MKKFTADSTEGYEHELRRISCELHEVAKAIERIGDRMVAGELVYVQMILGAFTINSELRVRQGGKRTLKEWLQCHQFMLRISRIHQDFAEIIVEEVASAVEEEEEKMKNES
jgi:hypothetical protein